MPELADVARTALLEITADATIGAFSGSTEIDGVTTITFEAAMAGYPGWHWTVGIATLPDAEPSVLEVELMPGDGALLSPDWVPWSERLAEYEAAQEAVAAEDIDDESTEIGDDLDDDELDDDDDLGSDVLHGGDLDGVDIDDLDEDLDDDGDADEDDPEDDRTY